MKKKIGIVELAMRYRQIMLLLITVLVLVGIYALREMPKLEFPEFTIRQGVVIGVYPGANVNEVEEQLTKPLEKYLLSFPEVNKKKTYSHSQDGIVYVFVELADEITDKDVVWSKIKHNLTTFKSSLPAGVMALIANDNFGDVSSLLIAVESEDKTYRELDEYINSLENRLRKIPSAGNLNRYGSQKEQISIYLDNDKLSTYGIGANQLTINMFTQGFTTGTGKIDNPQQQAPIHLSQSFGSEKEIEEQIVYSDPLGNVIRVKDIAKVVREYPKANSYITNNEKKCVLLAVEIKKGANVVAFGEEVDEVLTQFQNELPESVSMYRIADQPDVVVRSINTFLKELLMAIGAVILVTMILLPFRVAAVAATSIPVTIFISLAVLYMVGIPLNMTTLAALIIVLGMIVDNSIVIVDNYLDKLDHGLSRWHASITSAKEYFKSILSATLAISITFVPFLITTKGTNRDFLLHFPGTICITLGISLLIAMLFIPFIQYVFIKKGLLQVKRERLEQGLPVHKSFLDYLQKGYDCLLAVVFRHPKLTISIAILSVFAGLFLFSLIPQRMMPVVERNQFAVEIYLPQGSSLEQTAAVSDSMQHILRRDKRVKSVTAFVGESSPRFHVVYAPNMPSKAYAQFIVNTTTAKATEAMLAEYTDKYANYYPEAYVKFKQLDFQAVAAPIEVRFSGENIPELKQQAEKLTAYLNSLDECLRVKTNFEEVLPGAEIMINQVEAGNMGLNKTLLSMSLSSTFNHTPVSTLWEEHYPLSIVLKPENTYPDFNDIKDTKIAGMIAGSPVSMRQIADIKPVWNDGQIVHRNGMRTISVLADLKWQVNSKKVLGKVKEHMNAHIIPSLPSSVAYEYGGEEELDGEVLPNMIKAIAIAFCITFFILVFHFRRLNLATLTFSSSMLSLFGAAFGVWIMGIDFSVTAMLGIVSLVGIIVRNGIIMFDYTDELVHVKRPVREAAFEAGKRRMRPIFLTSAAASMGVLPMIISKSLLWSPLGVVIFFGTMISMIFVVTVLPVSYWMIFRNINKNNATMKINKLVFFILLLSGPSVSLAAQEKLTLEQCRALALKSNKQYQNSALEIKSAHETRKEMFTKYFPGISAFGLGFQANKSMAEINMGTPEPLGMLKKGIMSGVTAVQPIFSGGQIVNGNKLAKIGTEISKLKLLMTENELLLSIESYFQQLIALEENLKTLKEADTLLGQAYKDAENAFNAGMVNKNDILKVMLKQNEQELNKLKVNNGLAITKMVLSQLIGAPNCEFNTETNNINLPPSPTNLRVDHESAVMLRPEYLLLEQNIKAKKAQLQIKVGENLPMFSVGVGYNYFRFDKGSPLAMKNDFGMVFATLSIPISSWWGGAHAIKKERINIATAQNVKQDSQERLIIEMQQTWNELDESYQQILLTEISIHTALENVRLNSDYYKAGTGLLIDLLDAQTTLQQCRNNLTEARTGYYVKLYKYKLITKQ